MRRTSTRPARSGCPIGIALDQIGDPWSLLVVRDLMFKGATRFHDFLNAGEGIATNVLSDRLARLEAAELISKRPDPDDARRFVYRLTRKGIDLAPMLVELVLWSAKHAQTDAPPEVLRAMRGDRDAFVASVVDNWRATAPRPSTTKPRGRRQT